MSGRSGKSGLSVRSRKSAGSFSVRPEVPGCLEDPIDSEDLEGSGRSREPRCPEVSKSDGFFSDSRVSLTQRAKK